MAASRPQQLLHGGGLDAIEVGLHVPHFLQGGADREVERSEPVEGATDSLCSGPEDTVSPAVAGVLPQPDQE